MYCSTCCKNPCSCRPVEVMVPNPITGPQGPQGKIVGPQGNVGQTGLMGPQGPSSTTVGPQGLMGPQGSNNTTLGSQGPQGPIGNVGPIGTPYIAPLGFFYSFTQQYILPGQAITFENNETNSSVIQYYSSPLPNFGQIQLNNLGMYDISFIITNTTSIADVSLQIGTIFFSTIAPGTRFYGDPTGILGSSMEPAIINTEGKFPLNVTISSGNIISLINTGSTPLLIGGVTGVSASILIEYRQ